MSCDRKYFNNLEGKKKKIKERKNKKINHTESKKLASHLHFA